jgi:hypothetical protein
MSKCTLYKEYLSLLLYRFPSYLGELISQSR